MNVTSEVFTFGRLHVITKLIIRRDGFQHLVVCLSELKEFVSNSDAGVFVFLDL